MTTSDPALTMLAAWLRPVLVTVDEESMDQCRLWVTSLAESPDAYVEDLARAAFGKAPDELVRTLESALATSTATYSPQGNTALVCHLSAAALLHLVDQGGEQAADIACRCESLLFLGWTSVIEDLPVRLRSFTEDQAKVTRKRISVDGTLRAVRKKAVDEDEQVDETARLSASLEESQALLNRVVDRLANVVNEFNARLELLDEEIDALWWARSGRSGRTGDRWSDLSEIDRTVQASMDVASIVSPRLPTAGTWEVLLQVLAPNTSLFDLVEAVAALEKAGWSVERPDSAARAPFRPLAEGVALMRQFDSDASLVAKALGTSLGLAPGHKITPAALARQILNENWLQDHDE